jgi:hypothetical protein
MPEALTSDGNKSGIFQSLRRIANIFKVSSAFLIYKIQQFGEFCPADTAHPGAPTGSKARKSVNKTYVECAAIQRFTGSMLVHPWLKGTVA